MTMTAEYTEKIPTYALPYLVNGDPSGLQPEDLQKIGAFMAPIYTKAEETGGHVLFTVGTEEDPAPEPYFSWNPAFGLACNVVNCTILILGS